MVALCGLYSFVFEPNWLEITRHDLRRDSKVEGVRVVQLSDLHLQAVGAYEQAIAKQALAEKPDVVILSGDVIDRSDSLRVLEDFLALLGSVPVVAVLGNWEHWSGVDLTALKDIYGRRHATHLLVNESVTMSTKKRSIHILGLDDFTAGNPEMTNVSSASSAETRIVVQHSPRFFADETIKMSLPRVDLCVAGHTHGGQVTLFGYPLWLPPGSGPFVSGFYETESCKLYVSRGVGTSLLPLRFGARPEMVVFEM